MSPTTNLYKITYISNDYSLYHSHIKLKNYIYYILMMFDLHFLSEAVGSCRFIQFIEKSLNSLLYKMFKFLTIDSFYKVNRLTNNTVGLRKTTMLQWSSGIIYKRQQQMRCQAFFFNLFKTLWDSKMFIWFWDTIMCQKCNPTILLS